jgi:hypothetical protein
MLARFFYTILIGVFVTTTYAATPSQHLSDTAQSKEVSCQLTNELEALVEGFTATSQHVSNNKTQEKIQTLPIIVASWESIKQAGQKIRVTNNQTDLSWLNFSLQEVINGIKRASLKLHLLDPELSPFGFNHIGDFEHYRILGDVYAYLLSWLHHQCIQQPHVLSIIDNKIISTLIRTSARKSFECWWIIQKIRLSRTIFDVDLYDYASGLVDEYFAFIKACNSNDASLEQILASSKILLAHCADKKALLECNNKNNQAAVVIDALMNSVIITCQKLTTPPPVQKSNPEQTIHDFISNLFSGNLVNKNIIQPLLKKYGASVLQYFLNVMKETPKQDAHAN